MNYYDENEKSYYLLKDNIKPEEFDEKKTNEDKIITFEDDERHESKIFNLFSYSKNNKYYSHFDNLFILFKTLFLNEETIFIIWGIILNLLYICTNSPILIIVQILSVYYFSPLFSSFFFVIKDKFKQFFTLLILTWIVQYIFSWLAFLYLQDLIIGEYRMIKPGYDYDKDVNNK